MKEKRVILIGVIVCLSLSLALSFTALAEDTPAPPSDEQAVFTPAPFAEADALRYGGLFGPLTEPSPEFLPLPLATDTTTESPSTSINTRDMGFGSDEGHYIPITKTPVKSSP